MGATQRIFLSYRREDASAWAGRLRDALAREFGDRNIFQDVVAVRPGENFPNAIEEAIGQADVVLAVIGPNWAAGGAGGEPRLAEAGDYVRAELVAALALSKRLIPVLVGGATMPATAALPEDVRALASRHAVVLQDATWHRHVEALISSLRGRTATARRRRRLVAAGVAGAVAVGLVAGGAVAWVLVDDPGSAPDGNGTPTDTANPSPILQTCPTPREPEWTRLGATGDADVGDPPALHVEVLEASAVPRGSRHYIVLKARTTNLAEGSQTHYASYYKVTGNGETFPADCFAVVGGENPIGPGESSTALVGFDTTIDPTAGFTLDLDDFGAFGRIDLNPRSG